MYRACIAIIDASRARLFTFERIAGVDAPEEQLTEQRDLVNPARRLRPSELFSDSRPGSSRTGDNQFGFDDHRDAHIDQLDIEFARDVVSEIEELLRSSGARRLIVCASPRMLGTLREVGRDLRRDGLVIDELPRDLVKLTPPQVRERLTSYSLLPPPPPRAGLRRGA
ncbi:MAG TPA: host attachment protein [Kofleriaceae bacterium]|nr:host attachment protein [Kofleriaceae bacterium]